MFLEWSIPGDEPGEQARLLVLELDPPDSSLLRALRPSERDVVRGVALGESNAEIARRRSSSPRTVANQLASIFGALRVRSRAELVRRAFGGEVSS